MIVNDTLKKILIAFGVAYGLYNMSSTLEYVFEILGDEGLRNFISNESGVFQFYIYYSNVHILIANVASILVYVWFWGARDRQKLLTLFIVITGISLVNVLLTELVFVDVVNFGGSTLTRLIWPLLTIIMLVGVWYFKEREMKISLGIIGGVILIRFIANILLYDFSLNWFWLILFVISQLITFILFANEFYSDYKEKWNKIEPAH